MVTEWWSDKDMEGSGRNLNQGTTPEFDWMSEDNHEEPLRIVGVQAGDYTCFTKDEDGWTPCNTVAPWYGMSWHLLQQWKDFKEKELTELLSPRMSFLQCSDERSAFVPFCLAYIKAPSSDSSANCRNCNYEQTRREIFYEQLKRNRSVDGVTGNHRQGLLSSAQRKGE
jgi:hypothetical protein